MTSLLNYSYKQNHTKVQPTEYNKITINRMPESSIHSPIEKNQARILCGSGYFQLSDTALDQLSSTHRQMDTDTTDSVITSIVQLPCTWKSVYRVTLAQQLHFEPGDAIGLLVPNSDELVDEAMRLCQIEDQNYRIERSGTDSFVYEGSIRWFLKHKYDLSSIPKKIHLLNITRNSPMREQGEYLCSREGTLDYMRLAVEWCSIVDIIKHFQSKPSLDELLRNCEFIKPRYYTVASRLGEPCEILIGEMSTVRRDGLKKYGHVSSFIAGLHFPLAAEVKGVPCLSISVGVVLRHNILTTRLRSDNLICFCTGTGISPFLAAYHNRTATQQFTLVYGFRNGEDDLTRHYDIKCPIIRARSSEGVYVTDYVRVIADHPDSCDIFICGNPKMQRTVFLAIKELFPDAIEEQRVFFDNWQ